MEYESDTFLKHMTVLEGAYRRPEMFLGERSLSRLAAFLSGYEAAARMSFFGNDFSAWLTDKFSLPKGHGWIGILIFEFRSESGAFDQFLPLLKEYHASKAGK